MLDLEIVAVKCLDCEQMVWAGDDHPCWVEELGMRALEEAMWKKYQAGQEIDPDELGPEAQQAMNAFHLQESGGTWQDQERQADFERIAYCGWEEF